MLPDPFLALISPEDSKITVPPEASALFLASDPLQSINSWQSAANAQGLPLIRPSSANTQNSDGFWTPDALQLANLRTKNENWQLAGVAQDRHSAISLAEAGADLLVFAVFDPASPTFQLLPGDIKLAMWWTQVSEIPCAPLLPAKPDPKEGYGLDGMPEFYLVNI